MCRTVQGCAARFAPRCHRRVAPQIPRSPRWLPPAAARCSRVYRLGKPRGERAGLVRSAHQTGHYGFLPSYWEVGIKAGNSKRNTLLLLFFFTVLTAPQRGAQAWTEVCQETRVKLQRRQQFASGSSFQNSKGLNKNRGHFLQQFDEQQKQKLDNRIFPSNFP